MNRALIYLWFALLRGRMLKFGWSLRRPTSLIGALAVVGLLGFLFYFRAHKLMGELVRKESLLGAGLVMLCGSVFKGFLQRGLLCETADIEFLFTSPFTQRQVVLYRLLPSYLFAVVQSLVVLTLFAPHFRHPLIAALCLTLFQVVCFHLATAAAIFGGSIGEQTHHRLCCMLLALFALIAVLYLRLAWDFKVVPSFCSSSLFQLWFYPAVTLSDAVNVAGLHRWAYELATIRTIQLAQLWTNMLWLGCFALAAAGSLWALLRLEVSPFEAALATTTRAMDKRRRVRHGQRTKGINELAGSSAQLPRSPIFHGVGAILWKNLLAVRRSRREMVLASVFTLIYTGFFTALLWIYHDLTRKAGGAPFYEARSFTTGIAMFLGLLAFLLQRMFPFDFRRDGEHLLTFRTLPASALALTVAEIAVPTALCLLAQGCGVIPLMIWGKFDLPTFVLVSLGYPAVSLALNAVWNIHYLSSAAKRLSGSASANNAVGTLMVVALSFLVFYPAGWTIIKVANLLVSQNQSLAFASAAVSGLAVQYGIDLLLVIMIARLFQRFEISRDA